MIKGRNLLLLACACALICLGGCASSNSKATAAQSDSQLATVLDQAQAARQAGDHVRAGNLLRDAAKAYPNSKLPWLKLAQMHFDSRDYSQAIAASSEALQRDATDNTALSISAVSGLRVAAQSLQQMRKANSSVEVSGSSRAEAESLAQAIRDSLGESVLVPPPATRAHASGASTSGAAASAPANASGRSRSTGTARPSASANSATAGTSARSAPEIKPADKAVPPARGGNPFTILQ